MTIPKREEALKALDKLSSDYDLAGGWSPDPMPLLATLRSYIESHTGEVLAHEWHERFGLTCCKVCGLVRNENSDAKGCRGPVYVSLRDASPVQPDHIVDAGKMICPRSANGRPEGFTVRECVAAGECGCGESVMPGSTVRTSPVQPVKLEWQPFDTAKEDGNIILVYRADAGVFTAHYVEEDAHLSSPMNPPEGDSYWFSTSGEDLTDDLPTHWMPLPTPPLSGGDK